MIPATLRRHWPAFAIALLAGGLVALPPFWAKVKFDTPLDDPVNIRAADEFYYFARIRDVLDGRPFSQNPFTGEVSSGLPGQPVFLGEYLTAKTVGLTGLGVVGAGVLLDFVLPMVAVLLAYACLFAVTHQRWLAVFGTTLLFFWFFPGDFGRTVSPQTNFLFWLAAFLLLHALFTQAHSPRRLCVFVISSAAMVGLLAYIYTYYWTFWLVFLGAALLVALVRRDAPYLQRASVVFLGTFLVSLPFIVLLAHAVTRPEYLETVRRIGLIDTHVPSGIAIVVPAAVLLASAYVLVRIGAVPASPTLGFLALGAVAAVASVNQHVITGKNLEFSSHYYMLSVFWFVFFGAHLVSAASSAKGWSRRVGLAAAILTVVLAGFGISESVPPTFSPERIQLRRYVPVMNWINAHISPGEVVLAPLELSNLIPIYASADVFFSPWLRLALASDEEVLDRFAVAARGERWEPDAAVRTVFGVQYLDAALHTAQENRARRLLGLSTKPVDPLPAAVVRRIEERRSAVEPAWPELLVRYRADYIALDRRTGRGTLDADLSVSRVYDQGDFVVYRLRH